MAVSLSHCCAPAFLYLAAFENCVFLGSGPGWTKKQLDLSRWFPAKEEAFLHAGTNPGSDPGPD
jgi:hypothetical protein